MKWSIYKHDGQGKKDFNSYEKVCDMFPYC